MNYDFGARYFSGWMICSVEAGRSPYAPSTATPRASCSARTPQSPVRAAAMEAYLVQIAAGLGAKAMRPSTADELRAEGLSDGFVGYMRSWPGFVAE